MAYSNGKITAPISIDNIKNALGESSNDLGTLCKSDKINMWSKYKPVSKAKLFDMTDSDFANVNYGISSLPWVATYEACKAYIGQPNTSYYIYAKPLGGSSSPYRLGDFVNYDSTATPPIYASDRTSLIQGIYNGERYVDVYINIRGYNSHPLWLNLSSLDYRYSNGNIITAAKDCYLGLVLQGENGTFETITSIPISILTEGDQINLSIRISNNNCYGAFTMMPFLIASSSLPAPQDGYHIVNCLPLLMAQSNITIQQLVPNINIESITYVRTSYGSGYKLTITSMVITNTGIPGDITSIGLYFVGQNIITVTDKNILLGTLLSIPTGTTTLGSSNFNDPNVYTKSTSGIIGSLTTSLYENDNYIDKKERTFGDTIPENETY